MPLYVKFLCKIPLTLQTLIVTIVAKTQLKFEELKEVIKISIICTEYGSKIVIVPLLVKAVMRNTQILCGNFTFFKFCQKRTVGLENPSVKSKILDLTNPLFSLET